MRCYECVEIIEKDDISNPKYYLIHVGPKNRKYYYQRGPNSRKDITYLRKDQKIVFMPRESIGHSKCLK